MTKKLLILFLIFIIFVIYLTPAKLAQSFIPASQAFSVTGMSGTIWSGKINQIGVGNIELKDTEFSLSLLALLTANLKLSLNSTMGDILGNLAIYLPPDPNGTIQVSDANLNFNAALFESYLPFPGTVLKGKLSSSDLSVLILRKKLTQMSGKVHWRNAEVSYDGREFTLGDFSAESITDDKSKNIQIKLLKTKNALGLEGNITLTPDGMLEFIGSVATNIDESLYNSIALFNNGKPAGGRLPIKYKQKIY